MSDVLEYSLVYNCNIMYVCKYIYIYIYIHIDNDYDIFQNVVCRVWWILEERRASSEVIKPPAYSKVCLSRATPLSVAEVGRRSFILIGKFNDHWLSVISIFSDPVYVNGDISCRRLARSDLVCSAESQGVSAPGRGHVRCSQVQSADGPAPDRHAG